MKKLNWKTMRSRLEKAVEEGIEILKSGGEEALAMAEKTGRLLKVEAEILGLKAKMAKLNEEFGSEVHRSIKSGIMRITPNLKKINLKLTALDRRVARKEASARRANIFVKRGPAARTLKAAKKISGRK